MATEPYLIRLAARLSQGLRALDEDRRQRHRRFVLSCQMPDGGFRGREGDSDLYYTGFAVRTLAVLGGLEPNECESVARYVRAQSQQRLSIIDLLSWLYTGLVVQASGGGDPFAGASPDWIDQIVEAVEKVRTADGGYAKTPEGAAGSTYHSFLVAQTYELIGRSVPNPDALVQFLYDRQRDDGGFVEIAPMKSSGTNPTAAAVALLAKLGALDDELRADVCGFLSEVRSSEGGFQANRRIPFADGLSTFTGLLTAGELGCSHIADSAKVEAFLSQWLEFPTGGFRGASWDQQCDVEYTFYGLGALGLLWSM
ncbi:MAG: prenyltransferase/squalene oxidase repeat-containing protein [Planctomycetaceae bacterium]